MSETNVIDIPLDLVHAGAHNVRKRFAEQDMAELTESIRRLGVLQPVLVTRAPQTGGHYILVSGERRYRAARAAGLATIPAVVRDLSEREAREVALIENLQRRDLTPIEEARGYQALIEDCGLKQEEVAKRVGVSQPQVSNRLRLLRLPEKAQALIEDGTLSAGHGLALLRYLPEGQVYEPFFSELLGEFKTKPGAVNDAESTLWEIARRHSKSLRPLQDPATYYTGYENHYALFDVEASCKGCRAALLQTHSWGSGYREEERRCIDVSCYNARQQIALGEIQAKARDKRQVGPGPEPCETPEERARREEEAREKERERQEQIQKRIEKAAKKAAPPIPEANVAEAARLRDLSALYWERCGYIFQRECYLELAHLVQHWKERLEIGASQMPPQMGLTGSLVIPNQGITVEQPPYNRPDRLNVSLDPLTLYWGTATVTDTAPTGPVYYRCGLVDSGSSKSLHQVLVVPCETRDVIMESASTVIMRRDLVPRLAALVMGLPAFPGPAEDEPAPEPETQADMSEPVIPDEDKPFDELPEEDEALDEPVAEKDADRVCPYHGQAMTDEDCAECDLWDPDAKRCLETDDGSVAPGREPPEHDAPLGKRPCPLWDGAIEVSDIECRRTGCDECDERVDGRCRLIAKKQRRRGGEVA